MPTDLILPSGQHVGNNTNGMSGQVGLPVDPSKSSIASLSGVSVAASSTQVVAANENRKEVVIVNDSDAVVYLGYGASAALNKGIRLNASGGALVEDRFKGAINAIAASSGKVVTVTEVS